MVFELFSIPVGNKFLIYAPLHNLATIVDRRAADQIRAAVGVGSETVSPSIRPILDQLRLPGESIPKVHKGSLSHSYFLGIISTRGCNMSCLYCDFAASKNGSPVMELGLARQAVDAYLTMLHEAGQGRAEIHFFGGEPFVAGAVIHFVAAYAELRASELDMSVRFEVTTNGLYSPSRCRWIADHIDTVVLSLDGPADIQDRYRPALNGRRTSSIISRNAKILSEGSADLILRACITAETVPEMPAIAAWMASEFHPSLVCFETLTPSRLSCDAGLLPPDPYEFTRSFVAAGRILEAAGIEAVLSTADLHALRVYFCPVGRDCLILSPDGAVDACYLLQEDWARSGLDLRLGWFRDGKFEIDLQALERIRGLTVQTKSLCTDCLCRYHCAGGCVVNHPTHLPPGQYDDLCIQTRLVTIAKLLKRLDQHALLEKWMHDDSTLQEAALQTSDRLFPLEAPC